MQKKIGYFNLDASTAQWLAEHLPQGEFRQAVQQLLCGEYSSLILEADVQAADVPQTGILRCGELVINPRARTVQRSGREIALTPKEFDILYFLAQNRGEVFTKEQIYQAVWDGDYLMDDSNIMAFIRKLRKKIEPAPDAPEYILTIWGIGYKFADFE